MGIDKHIRIFSRFVGSVSVFKLGHDVYHFGLSPILESVINFWDVYFLGTLLFILGILNIEISEMFANALIVYSTLYFAHMRRMKPGKLSIALVMYMALIYFTWPFFLLYFLVVTIRYYSSCFKAGKLLERSFPLDMAVQLVPEFFIEVFILTIVFVSLIALNYMFI